MSRPAELRLAKTELPIISIAFFGASKGNLHRTFSSVRAFDGRLLDASPRPWRDAETD